MKSVRKFILLIIVLLFAVIITGVIILYNYQSVSYEGTIYAGVDSEVLIHRDKHGVPLIKTASINDAYFSVGFLHYQDRQALIEYFRAIASGRLSELIGNDGIFIDKISLTAGFKRKAEDIISKLKSPYYDYLASYVKGINASKKINGAGFLSRFSFREWTIDDVISILLLFEWTNAFQNNKELTFPVHKTAGRHLKEIIPSELWYQYDNKEKSGLDFLLRIKEEVKNRVGLFQSGFAFYIDSKNLKRRKAVSGFTLDSNIGIFSKWYPLRLIIEERKLDCITASGLPFLLYGRNDKITYFGFNLCADAQIFRIERVRKIKNTEKYYRNGTWYDFSTSNEKIYSGYSDDVDKYMEMTIRSTDNGPVISDLEDNGNNNVQCISMNSIFPDESYIKSVFDLPFAESVSEAFKTVRFTRSLPKTYLFCSENDVVRAYFGRLFRNSNREIFSKGYTKATFDISGYSRRYKNRNVIIGDKLYSDLPAFIRNRNNKSADNRYLRFDFLIENKSPLEPEDIAFILKDTYSITAEKYVPLFLTILAQFPIPSAKLASIYFEEWDYNLRSDSVASTIFEVLFVNLLNETFSDELGDGLPEEKYSLLADKLYRLMSQHRDSPLFDNINTKNSIETRDIIFDRAFIKTLRLLNKLFGPVMENWKWGRLHKGETEIPLINDSILNYYRYRMRENPEYSGGNNTVLKGSVDAENLLKPVSVSVMSGIYYIDPNLFLLRSPIPQSVVPSSEFYRNYTGPGDFVTIDMSDLIYTYTILSGKN